MIEDLDYLEQATTDRNPESFRDWYSDSPVTMTRDFCDIEEFEDHTTWAVSEFMERDCYREPSYTDASIEQRAEYMLDFHNNFSELSGYSNNLHFSENMSPCNLGAFDPITKRIDLNANLLRDGNPEEVMKTIMHESRHAYQDFAIKHWEEGKVSVDEATVRIWKDNFAHYISPEYDFEAYCNQPVEKDANDFADRMYENGMYHSA